MQSGTAADLITEAERYLVAVATFRAEGCEPNWRLEKRVARGIGTSPSERIAIDDLLRRFK